MSDNAGCPALAKDLKNHSQTNHIYVQHHFICIKMDSRHISLSYCPTKEMVANVLNKALAKVRHEKPTKAMRLRRGHEIEIE